MLVRFFLHGLIVSTWVSRLPGVQVSLGLSNEVLGFCLLGTSAGSILAVPISGWIIGVYGSKRLATWGTLGFSLSLVPITLAQSPVALFAALLLFGAMGAANDVSINSQAVAVESVLGTPAMSRFHALFSIGGIGGALWGGFLAGHGVAARIHLAIMAAALALVSVLTAPLLFDARNRELRASRQGMRLPKLPALLVVIVILAFCMFLSEGAIADWSGVYLKQVLHSGTGTAAVAYAAFCVGMAGCRLAGDELTKRLGTVATFRAGALTAATGLSIALISHSIPGALCGFAITGAGFSVTIPLIFGAGGRVKGVSAGMGIAIVSGSGYVGLLAGPAMIGLVAHNVSLRFALSLLVWLTLVTAVLARAVGQVPRFHSPDHAAAPQTM